MADRLVLEAVERFGPRRTVDMAGGWQRLSTALTNQSAAAAPFIAWRRGIFRDLQEYAGRELGENIQEQGSVGAFKNDLDISFMGENGAANRGPGPRVHRRPRGDRRLQRGAQPVADDRAVH